jgi:CheY-like chemotaxis protein
MSKASKQPTTQKLLYVPGNYCCSDGYNLGIVYRNIRVGGNNITESQRAQLENIGLFLGLDPQNKRVAKEDVTNLFHNDGYEVDTSTFINTTSMLRSVCPNKHEWYTNYNRFYSGNRCALCYGRYDRTKYEIAGYLRTAATILGKTPNLSCKLSKLIKNAPSTATVVRIFGTWSAALEYAKLNPNVYHISSKNEALNYVRSLAKDLGMVPTDHDMNQAAGYPCARNVKDKLRCSSWPEVIELAGLDSKARRRKRAEDRKRTKKELLAYLKKVAKILNKAPTVYEFTHTQLCDDAPCHTTYERHFGSWNEALKAAGLQPSRKYWSDLELLAVLRKLATELGRFPTTEELTTTTNRERPSVQTYYNRFGSWDSACRLAVKSA